MTAKMQAIQARSNLKGIARKIMCPDHQSKYCFKCQHPNCESPFICPAIQCIEAHSHQQKIVMTKFKSESLSNKFYEVQSMISDDTMNDNARVLKSYIQSLKDSIKNVYIGIKSINQNYDYLKGDLEGSLTLDYIRKVEQNYQMNQSVRKSLDQLKNKVKIQFPLKDSYFSLRSYLIEFLSEHIPGFSWSKSKQIYSSKNQLTTCQRFHEKLVGMKDLLFLFIGDKKMIGSYYSCSYPSILQRNKKDRNSFLFINSKDDPVRFIKYVAAEQTDQHISISQKNYICHGNTPSYGDGIRTFHKNFDSIEYSLPSNTFVSEQEGLDTISGTLRVKRFLILQVNENKQQQQIGSNGKQYDELD